VFGGGTDTDVPLSIVPRNGANSGLALTNVAVTKTPGIRFAATKGPLGSMTFTGIIAGMDLVELSRRLENILRIGTIHAVDHAAVKVRVKTGELVTQWLPWIEQRAGQTTTWNPPTLGEQAIVFSPSGEPAGGIVLVGIDSTAIQPPSHNPDDHATRYPDGTLVRYDHAAGIMEAVFPDGGEIRLSGQPMQARSNRQAIDAGIAYVSEDGMSLGVLTPSS
jgi:phage baseplate assembly protein V